MHHAVGLAYMHWWVWFASTGGCGLDGLLVWSNSCFSSGTRAWWPACTGGCGFRSGTWACWVWSACTCGCGFSLSPLALAHACWGQCVACMYWWEWFACTGGCGFSSGTRGCWRQSGSEERVILTAHHSRNSLTGKYVAKWQRR